VSELADTRGREIRRHQARKMTEQAASFQGFQAGHATAGTTRMLGHDGIDLGLELTNLREIAARPGDGSLSIE